MTHAADHAAPLRLEYRAEASADTARRGWRAVSLAMLLPGLIVPFVPFACDDSPTEMVMAAGNKLLGPTPFADADELVRGLLGVSAFIAFPLVAWAVRRLRPGLPSRWLRAVLLASGALGALAVATVLGSLAADMDSSDAVEWSVFGASAALFFLAIAVFVVLTIQRRGVEQRVTVALAGPYAAIFVLFLIAWAAGRQVGWYLALAPTAAAVGELLAAAAVALRGNGVRRISD
jgi:hypothetical protein